jgi:hypothetical protein
MVTKMRFVLSIPYVEVFPLKFGMSKDEAMAIMGWPDSRIITRNGELDLRYHTCSLRFSKDIEQLVEIGFFPSADILVDGINLFREPDYYRVLIDKDAGVLEYVGVLFFPYYGITLTGFHDSNASERTITAFVRGRMDHLIEKFQPFRIRK